MPEQGVLFCSLLYLVIADQSMMMEMQCQQVLFCSLLQLASADWSSRMKEMQCQQVLLLLCLEVSHVSGSRCNQTPEQVHGEPHLVLILLQLNLWDIRGTVQPLSGADEVLKIGKHFGLWTPRCKNWEFVQGMCLGKIYRVRKNDGLLIILHRMMLIEVYSIHSRVSFRYES